MRMQSDNLHNGQNLKEVVLGKVLVGVVRVELIRVSMYPA